MHTADDHDFLCNTGYSDKDDRTSITLTFENTGVYSFDSMKVMYVSQLKEHGEPDRLNWGQESLEDVQIGNRMDRTGNISVSEA